MNCSVGHAESFTMLIDSGSDWNLLSEQDWSRLENLVKEEKATIYDLVENPGETARAYGAPQQLWALRSFHAWTEALHEQKPRIFAKFRVVKNGNKSILSHGTSMRMRLLQVGSQVSAVTEEKAKPFPSIPNLVLEFDVDESVPATKNAYVNIPVAYRQKANERLERMEAENIIEKVTSAPKWISGMSAVPKGKEDFRLVINMMGPNRAIQRRFYKMPTLEEIRVRLNGATIFTKLDLTWAFYHVKLGEKSRELTTFLSPNGMYRFVRLVFGVNCAPEAFQQVMEDIMKGIKNVIVYIDDLLLYDTTPEGLRETTQAVLAALKSSNLTINEKKCEYEKAELEFLGHALSASGLNISEKKVEDIRKFREPRNASELKAFLGLASFLSGYIRHFATIAKPMWDAAKAKEFVWDKESQEAFLLVKQAIIDCTIAQGFFSNADKTQLYTDASPVALGAVLVQENQEGMPRIISFASKLLTEVESRYPQTQKEALAIVWGAEHFWFYLLGRKFLIKTDAQGISFIMKKERTASNRMLSRAEGWALRMSRFDFEVEFIEGVKNIADPSSRLLEGVGQADFEESPAPGEIMTLEFAEPGDVLFDDEAVTIEEIIWHTQRSEELLAVIQAVETDTWGRKLAAYKSVRSDLRISNGMLTRMGAAVIPQSLRQKTLVMAHRGHPGERATKSILRGKVWWPGMSAQAGRWVKFCKTCTLSSRRSPPMPMQRGILPDSPWDELSCDFCGPYQRYGGTMILVVVDAYSRYLIALPVKSTDFESARAALEATFSVLGYPRAIKTDNGPPFNGHCWLAYLRSRGIEGKFSTPLDAQQNGGVETYMRIIGKGMSAPSVEDIAWKKSLSNAVAAHNAAECEMTGVAPEALMFGRKLRRNLPVIKPNSTSEADNEIRERDWAKKMKAKSRDDQRRGAKYSDIVVGDKVYATRQTKAKGETTFHPSEFTVIAKNHGTLELLSPLGFTMKRTVTFVKKVTRGGDSREGESDDPSPVEETKPEDNQPVGQGKIAPSDEAEEAPPALRRSTRVKRKPTYLGSYVRLLGWEID